MLCLCRALPEGRCEVVTTTTTTTTKCEVVEVGKDVSNQGGAMYRYKVLFFLKNV